MTFAKQLLFVYLSIYRKKTKIEGILMLKIIYQQCTVFHIAMYKILIVILVQNFNILFCLNPSQIIYSQNQIYTCDT